MIKKPVVIMILLLSTLGCGPKMVYPHLDWLIPRYVDDYITLDSSQRGQLADRLARQLDWHCRTQLPQYAEFLRELRMEMTASDKPVSVDRLAGHYATLKRYGSDLITHFAPDIVAILTTATDEQIDELFRKLEKKNRQLRGKYLEGSEAERTYDRQKRMQKRLRYWLSELTDDQKQAVAAWNAQLAPTAADWLAHRRNVQAAWRHLLAQRNENAAFKVSSLQLLTAPERLRTQSYQNKLDANIHHTLVLLARLSHSLTPAQRDRLSERLAATAKDLEQLACPAGKAAKNVRAAD